MTRYPWRIDVRDSALNRIGELDDYQQLEMLLKFNDISTWRLVVDRTNRLAEALVQPGAGIVVSRNGTTVLSGTWTDRDDVQDENSNTLTLSGVDDTVWLKLRQAHPQPGTAAPPYSTSAEEVWTGAVSSVSQLFVQRNVGSDALAARRKLTSAADPSYGGTVTGRARWQPLLTLLQELAVAGPVNGIPYGFRVVQVDDGLQYQGYVPVDRTADAMFSKGFSNLQSFKYRETAPEANYWYVGGDGEGTARTMYEMPDSASIAVWGRREGELVDARSADTTVELQQAALNAQADAGATTSLAVTPIDTDSLAFGIHYGLGDRVTAVIDVLGPGGGDQAGDMVQDILRQCKIVLASDATEITSAIGTDNASAESTFTKIFKRVAGQGRRLINLERR